MNNITQKPNLLLVDDKPENLFVLEKLLTPLNVNLRKATSGSEALAMALQEELVLILLDVQMPEMDGYEVLELMHAEERLKKVPVIFITAYFTDEQHQLKGYELGAADYLYKPLDERVLLSKVSVFLDLDRQRRENQHLQQRYELILDSAGEGIFGLSPDGTINFANLAASTLLGKQASELLGTSLEAILPKSAFPDGHYDWKKTVIYQASFSGYFHRVVDSAFLKSDGRELPVDYVVTSIRGEHNEYLGVVVVFSDATVRKLNEQTHQQLQQVQKMEAIGQLTGGVAHDFNNLLTTIQGNLELLREKIKPDAAENKRIDAALKATERGSELTKRLLAFARKQTLYPKRVDLKEQIENAVAFLKPTLGENIEIIVSLQSKLWPVWVDPSQLENAIANLAINARDAMPRGGKLSIEAQNISLDEQVALGKYQVSPGEYVQISITDNGTGMTPEVQKHIFEPFFTTKEVGKGTGLGLSMIYGFVKQSKGHVTIYSESDNGTTFNLYLPRATQDETPQKAAKTVAPITLRGQETILVVEDEKPVLDLVTDYLQELGYQVENSQTAAQALELLKQGKKIDLLFSDVIMPGGMTGPELAVEAKILLPNLKILFTSGYPQSALAHKGHFTAEEQYLTKPYKLDTLASKIRKILE